MRKYYFEADKLLLDRAYVNYQEENIAPAQAWVCAQDEASATAMAQELLAQRFAGTGVLLGTPRLLRSYEVPADWSYGYGPDRQFGPTAAILNPVGNAKIR